MIYAKGGLKGFWVGFTACVYRAWLVGAVELSSYELAT